MRQRIEKKTDKSNKYDEKVTENWMYNRNYYIFINRKYYIESVCEGTRRPS